MWKKIFILIIFLGFLGYISFFSGINFAFALTCVGVAPDCQTYCTGPCNPSTGIGWNSPDGTLCICNPWSATSIQGLIDSVINFIFLLATGIVPVFILIAGFYFMTAGGNPANIEKAKKIIIYTIIGYSIILFAKAIVYVLKAALGVS
jgi:hypothetical protein